MNGLFNSAFRAMLLGSVALVGVAVALYVRSGTEAVTAAVESEFRPLGAASEESEIPVVAGREVPSVLALSAEVPMTVDTIPVQLATSESAHQLLEDEEPERRTTTVRETPGGGGPLVIERRQGPEIVHLESLSEHRSAESRTGETLGDIVGEGRPPATRIAQGTELNGGGGDLASQLETARELLDATRKTPTATIDLRQAIEALRSSKGAEVVGPKPTVGDSAPRPVPALSSGPSVLKAEPSPGGAEQFSLQMQNASIREIMEMLGQLSGTSILVGSDVSGEVSANLENVTIDEALSVVLRSEGLVHEREGKFIFIMTADEAEQRKRQHRKIVTKIYRPNYISVADLQALISPLTTENIGKIALTAPAESGIGADNEKAGGDNISQQDALLVQDYADVIEEIDAVFEEMDVPPAQIVIEAMILSVTLDDTMEFGVNFALLNKSLDNFAVAGNGRTLNAVGAIPDGTEQSIIPAAGQFITDTAGLKYGAISKEAGVFVNALESVADTNLIASPQLRVLNKQKAQLIIGDRISYKTLAFNGTQTVENVNFLDSGTRLILRPFISADGMIRMAIHPERSSAVLDKSTGLPNQQTTEVTTNIMMRDEQTIVIGGLIEEQVTEGFDRVPFLGALPLVGPAFRSKSESVKRTELIILITPRIVRTPEDAMDGAAIQAESERRAANFRDNLMPINRRNLARMEYEKAQDYFENGRLLKARTHIHLAMRHSKNDNRILQLRDQIEAGIRDQVGGYFPLPTFEETETEPAEEVPVFDNATDPPAEKKFRMRLPSFRSE